MLRRDENTEQAGFTGYASKKGEGVSSDNLVKQYGGATFPALAHLAAEGGVASGL